MTHGVGGDTMAPEYREGAQAPGHSQSYGWHRALRGEHRAQAREAEPRPQGITECPPVSPIGRANTCLAKPPP